MTETKQDGARRPHLPGEEGVWGFILGDMVVFALLFGTFVYYRSLDVPTFAASQTTLNQTFGVINTFLMLTSSWFVALAVDGVRTGHPRRPRLGFALAIACGLAFIVLKWFEYGEKFSAGIHISTNDFYMYYFVLTGIHLLHVVIGVGVLAFLWAIAKDTARSDERIRAVESGASFWHLVDMLWIVLFGLLYLMR